MTNEVTTDNATVSVYTDTFNKRIRIDHYAGDLNEIRVLIHQQISDWVEKLIVKSRGKDLPFFIAHGFSCEGFIKGYFAGDDMYFVTMYFSVGRERNEKWNEEQSIIQKLVDIKTASVIPSIEGIKVATSAQANGLAHLYKEVFKVYPTPLSEEAHIIKAQQEGTLFAYIEKDDQIVSAASAEVNWKFKNAELTDCATLPTSAGKVIRRRYFTFLKIN
ncbi:MAG: hypothetical protein IPJ20_18000 [Flammeovirgaceae bacterium]|nr:hypothetical protein [Flammeovirgaceae bacterium]